MLMRVHLTDEYEPPFAFTGTIEKVVYDISGERVVDHEAEIRIALARQLVSFA